MNDTLIEIDGLVAGYGAPVVGPVSFDVQAGEILGLAGPNGVGKSTILSAITRTARVFGGSIVRRPTLTVAHQRQRPVRLADTPLVGGDLMRLAQAPLDRAPNGLPGLACSRLDRLSGGQAQLFFVWAAVGGPADLVLLDEPTNNMDPEAREALVQSLGSIGPRRSLVLVSHDEAFLQRVATRIVEVPRRAA
jgi:ATPase subunit of ABC transporter with duplicated ATPase domains